MAGEVQGTGVHGGASEDPEHSLQWRGQMEGRLEPAGRSTVCWGLGGLDPAAGAPQTQPSS